MNSKSPSKNDEPKDQRFSPPSVSLPKGGGAIKGIGEKFAANPVTGTGAMSVPLAISPGRSGFGPALALSYNSGEGNGPFGFGWSLSLPSITRKTDKGLPQYRDDEELDVFILSGAEDLVPELNSDGTRFTDNTNFDDYTIHRFKPRVEGLFARIERWTRRTDGDVHWRSLSRDNILTLYGKDSKSRIADPTNPKRIFSWLICETRDDKGNAILYDYKAEDGAGVDLGRVNERNRGDRDDPRRSANRYLKSVRYGNPETLLDDEGNRPRLLTQEQIQNANWMFEVVFDYGEHDSNTPKPNDVGQWVYRDDSFSSYREGFEVRTTRLCQRVLMFHHFPDAVDVGSDCLARSTDFTYSSEPDPGDTRNSLYSLVRSVTQTGYKRRADGSYLKKSLPPTEFTYSLAAIQGEVHEVDSTSLENVPSGLDGANYQWVDLDGEGLSGILTQQTEGWFYKRNLSPLNVVQNNGSERIEASFAPVELIASKPAANLKTGGNQLLDLAGDGQLDLVQLRGPVAGFYERTNDSTWESFRSFASNPNVSWDDPNLKFIDLTGDGHADVLVTEDEVFRWYPSLAEDGFGSAELVRQSVDEERGPRLLLADETESIYLADLSGDGLTDFVRIRNGDVCYWPNLGYGRFGAKVTMDDSPWFDSSDLFDQGRLRLADIDGSGTTDLIYLNAHQIDIYLNLSGNSWSAARSLNGFPQVDNLSAVQAVDLLGNGTACLVWSSPLPDAARHPMRYIDLMGGQKPHLLVRTTNNLGAETFVSYAPSTKFYLADKLAGTPWITKLPFPVHCVDKVIITDKWRQTRFSTSYSYHHGYFDGTEREFRGFGRIEQLDIESFGEFAAGNAESPYITDDKTLYQPPVKTVTWYHTGALQERERILSQFEHEYFPRWFEDLHPDVVNVLGEFQENVLPEPDLFAADLSPEEWREALRACKGMMLRQEVYELDVDALEREEQVPVKLFSTTYHNCHIRRLQAKGINRHAVFLVAESEAITYHYELDLRTDSLRPDPRIAHSLNLQLDEYANILQSVSVVYPRVGLFDDDTLATDAVELIQRVQRETHLAYSETRYTDDIDEPDSYRLRLACEALSYELTGIRPEDSTDLISSDPRDNRYFSIDELRRFRLSLVHQSEGEVVSQIAYHQLANSTTPEKRLVEQVRTLFFKDDEPVLSEPLAFGKLGSRALLYEAYKLALTEDLLERVFDEKLTTDVRTRLSDASKSGYLSGTTLDQRFPGTETDGQYWIRSGIVGFASDAAQHFYLPEKYTDPFGNVTTVVYDPLDLFVVSTTDALGNTSSITRFDFRVLAPSEMKDINDNLSEVRFDTLGLPTAMAVIGKGNEGDNLTGFDDALLNPEPGELSQFFTAATFDENSARVWLGNATARHVYYFGENIDQDGTITWGTHPSCACGILRETHVSQLGPDEQSLLQAGFEYSDGMGSVVVTKVPAEPESEGGPIRWVANGKTILNNKGKPVKQFEPYFSPTGHRFEEPIETGVTPVIYYDAIGRIVRTELPDGSFSRVEFSPWHVTSYDPNDTVRDSKWFSDQDPPDPDQPLERDPITGQLVATPKQRNAWLAAQHHNTPSLSIVDSLGRDVVSIAHNRVRGTNGEVINEKYLTFTKLDAEGKPLWIRDARKNLVMQYITPPVPDSQTVDPVASFTPCYDIAGNLLFQHSMDAGNRWMINDAAGKPMLAWDSREHNFLTEYDKLHRPVASFVTGPEIDTVSHTVQFEKIVYGDTPNNGLADPKKLNLRGKPYQYHDSAGIVVSMGRNPTTGADEAFDFKGNLLRSTRQLVKDYKATPDWSQDPDLETEIFGSAVRHDALNRPIQMVAPHSNRNGTKFNVIRPGYNEAKLLERVDVWLEQTSEPTTLLDIETATQHIVDDIDYNEKGQRTLIDYGNGVRTTYDYDPLTFRLSRLKTNRNAGFPNDAPGGIQNLSYFYDPVGNITRISDEAQQTIFFNGQKVEPSAEYEYDAIYRLVSAKGREHIGQNASPQVDHDDSPRMNQPLPTDSAAMRNYTEEYDYDPVGNILRMIHGAGTTGSWTRRYDYEETNNRLRATSLPGDAEAVFSGKYFYDEHGSMKQMPHLPLMQWDFRDQLQASSTQVVTSGTPKKTWYIYDAAGQRVRKVTDHDADAGVTPTRMKERIYLGGFEIYREYEDTGNTVRLERETLHIMDDKRRVAMVETRADSPDSEQLIRFQFDNHLGSASLELDDSAQIISYEEYHPYGSTSYHAVRNAVDVSPKRYRYTGMERDEESGLSYHCARYYAAWVSKWACPDPTGLKGGINLYRYAHCNPIVYSDKNGGSPDEFDTFDEYLPGLITDYPRLGQEWDSSTSTVLQNRYKLGSDLANEQAYHRELDSLPKGAKRTELARELFNSVRQGFYRSVGKLYKEGKKVLGDLNVPPETIDKMIKGGTRPAPGTQMDHAIQELAEEPKSALKAQNQGLRKGHAGVRGGSHNKATEGRKAFRDSRAPGGIPGANNVSVNTATAAQGLLQPYIGSNDPFEREIDDFKQWGFDLLTSLKSGPTGVFKTALDPERLGKVAVITMQSPHMFGAAGGLQTIAGKCMNPANCMKSSVDQGEALRISQGIINQLNEESARKAAQDPWYRQEHYTLDASVLSSDTGSNYTGPLAGRSYLPIYVYK